MPRKSSDLLKRRLKIAELVDRQGEIKVEDLSALLGVSGVTIRGDLSYLEQQGYLKRSFGGAIATPTPSGASSQEDADSPPPLTLANKIEIARHCSRTIAERETVFLGHGETIRRIIPFLSGLSHLRLIVNDLQHALLAEQFIDGEIIVAGDELIRHRSLLTGRALDDVIQRFTVNHCILEVGLDDASGECRIDQPLLARHYQRCLDKALNTTAVINNVVESSGPVNSLGNLSQMKTLVAHRYINEHFQQLISDAEFSIRYSNNECFTWSNRNFPGE
ncbi:DeoR/GlpR family DNA-binding transcription regulator [Erwiniaceae bacterium CAU 1747]